MKILFVCTGNTCRSPMAAGIFHHMLEESHTAGIICASAGLAAVEGQPASENAVLACGEWGIDLSGHRAHRITGEDLARWDVFFVMTDTQGYILEQAGASEGQIYVPENVTDPYGQDLAAYRACRDKLAEELRRFFQEQIAPGIAAQEERP